MSRSEAVCTGFCHIPLWWGCFLQNYEQYEVVKSSGIGILQHDAFTWQIEDGKFVKAVDIEGKNRSG